jgi:antirestriction protein
MEELTAQQAYEELFGTEFDEEHFEDCYHGEWDSMNDFVYDMLDSCGTLAEWTKTGMSESYIDFDAIANDWFISDFTWMDGHIFSNY